MDSNTSADELNMLFQRLYGPDASKNFGPPSPDETELKTNLEKYWAANPPGAQQQQSSSIQSAPLPSLLNTAAGRSAPPTPPVTVQATPPTTNMTQAYTQPMNLTPNTPSTDSLPPFNLQQTAPAVPPTAPAYVQPYQGLHNEPYQAGQSYQRTPAPQAPQRGIIHPDAMAVINAIKPYIHPDAKSLIKTILGQ